MLRLVTIPISHYCEKARWALERAGLPYREERHVQGIHRAASRRAGAGKGTVPVLVTPDGAIGESAEIGLGRPPTSPAQRLLPVDASERRESDALCRRLDDVLGPCGRRLMYVHMFTAPQVALGYNNVGVPRWEDGAIRRGWPVAARFVERAIGIRPGIEADDEVAVFAEFDHVAELLSDGRPFLAGERFGAADLTFAALSASGPRPARLRRPAAPARRPPRQLPADRRARPRASGRTLRSRGVQRMINETYSAFLQGFMPTLRGRVRRRARRADDAIIVDQERMGAELRSTVSAR